MPTARKTIKKPNPVLEYYKVPVIGLAAVVGAALCVAVLCRRRGDGTAEVGNRDLGDPGYIPTGFPCDADGKTCIGLERCLALMHRKHPSTIRYAQGNSGKNICPKSQAHGSRGRPRA
jgi:hypothetical protein